MSEQPKQVSVNILYTLPGYRRFRNLTRIAQALRSARFQDRLHRAHFELAASASRRVRMVIQAAIGLLDEHHFGYDYTGH